MNDMINNSIVVCMALISNLYEEINDTIDAADENLDSETYKVLCSLEDLRNAIVNLNLI